RTRHTSETRFRQMQIKLGQQLDRHLQRFCLPANLSGERTQNTLDLLVLLDLQLAQAIVQLNDHHRLYKDRSSTRRLIVHNTAHLATSIGTYRQDKTIITRRNNRLLQGWTKLANQRP